ncbi:MAG TPA: substrate-binding domain-containing protein [Vicinamibacteria bacterium]|nr:substrate-binding domain-containing protein [Vicinamibacteria bacterium]
MSVIRILLLLALAGGAAGAAEHPLIVRASPLFSSCVEASARSYAARGVRVGAGGGEADVLVASDVEVTRALETGMAFLDSDVDVARVPWVLRVPAGNPSRVASLDQALAQGVEIALPKDPAAYEARRLVAGRERVREDPEAGSAPTALLPLSLARGGEHIPTDIRPLHVRAVVLSGSKQQAAARAFASFLGSEAGQRAFAACGDNR